MPRNEDSGKRLANAIEQKLNLSRSDIKEMSNSEFRDLLRNGFFADKNYKEGTKRKEPTQRQMDVLNLHYGKETSIRVKGTEFHHKTTTKLGNVLEHRPTDVKKNSAGRWIDARTGKYVSSKR